MGWKDEGGWDFYEAFIWFQYIPVWLLNCKPLFICSSLNSNLTVDIESLLSLINCIYSILYVLILVYQCCYCNDIILFWVVGTDKRLKCLKGYTHTSRSTCFSLLLVGLGWEDQKRWDFYEALIWFQYIPLMLLNRKSLFTMDDQLVKM